MRGRAMWALAKRSKKQKVRILFQLSKAEVDFFPSGLMKDVLHSSNPITHPFENRDHLCIPRTRLARSASRIQKSSCPRHCHCRLHVLSSQVTCSQSFPRDLLLPAARGQSFHPSAQAEHQVPGLSWAGLAHIQECFLLTDSNPWVGTW